MMFSKPGPSVATASGTTDAKSTSLYMEMHIIKSWMFASSLIWLFKVSEVLLSTYGKSPYGVARFYPNGFW